VSVSLNCAEKKQAEWMRTNFRHWLKGRQDLREGTGRVAQFFDEHREGFFTGAARTMAGGDAQGLRRCGQRFQPDVLRDEPGGDGRDEGDA
jgi:hypothetical protein